jgi:hypothetical protein
MLDLLSRKSNSIRVQYREKDINKNQLCQKKTRIRDFVTYSRDLGVIGNKCILARLLYYQSLLFTLIKNIINNL